MSIQATVLSIAGSDPTGGAGIQADLKTMTSIGVYGAAAITCITVQNSRGVQKIQPLSPRLVQAQIQAVLDDHNVTHIKIGMTGTREIIECLAEILASFPGTVIYDPVLAATSGQALLQDGMLSLRKLLLPCISYLTPNIGELQILTQKEVQTTEYALAAAGLLLKSYPSMKGIIVKGGHLHEDSSSISDFLVQQKGKTEESKRKRIENNNLHGTGCTYASAFSSYLCLQNTPVTAFKRTGEYMNKIIQKGADKSATSSDSNGPLFHFLT